MATKLPLVARCIEIPSEHVDDLFALYAAERLVTFTTFARHCDWKPFARNHGYAIGRQKGLHLKDDRCVRFYRSVWRGSPCYYMDWSAIDHIYQNQHP